jgi:hydrogenase maturation protease
MGDDGFGPLAVEMFRCKCECGPNVEILDVGTPGLDLAPYFYGADLVIIADAVNADEVPGTLRIYCEAELMGRQAQLRLTDHDPGLPELVAHLSLAGETPSELIIVGVVPQSCKFGEGVSPAVLTASSAAVDSIAGLLRERGIDCSRRPAPTVPNLWWLSAGRSKLARQNPGSQN